MTYLGDYKEDNADLNFKFTSRQLTGEPFTLAGTPSLAVYKSNNDAESVAGITLSVDFDGVTGLNNVKIDLSADGFYEVGEDYHVVIAAGTVDSVSVVGEVVATFSIENRYSDDAAAMVDEWESQSQTSATGFRVNVKELDNQSIQTDGSGVIYALDNSGYTLLSTNNVTVANSAVNANVEFWVGNGVSVGGTTSSPNVNIGSVADNSQRAIDLAEIAELFIANSAEPLTDYVADDSLYAKILSYFQLAMRDDEAIKTDNATELLEINADRGSGAGTFLNTTDALEANRNRGDLAWLTGGSGGAMESYTSTDWTRTVGDDDGGAGSDTVSANGTYFATGEINSTTLLEVDGIFVVTAGEVAQVLDVWGFYAGGGSHVVNVQAYDIASGLYELIGTMGLGSIVEKHTFDLSPGHTNLANGEVKIKFIHSPGTGIVSHVLNIDKAQVNTNIPVDVAAAIVAYFESETHEEVGQEAPAATQSLLKMIQFLYKVFRNRKVQSSSTFLLYADDASTVDQKAFVNDDGDDFDKGEMESGPE